MVWTMCFAIRASVERFSRFMQELQQEEEE